MKAVRIDTPTHAPMGADRLGITREVLTSEGEFLKLRGSWDRIATQSPSHGPLQDWDYVLTWWRSFGKRCPSTGMTGHLHCVVVRSGAEIVGIVPFFWVEPRRWWLPRRLRQFGYSGRLEPFGMTEEPILAVVPNLEDGVVREVFDELDRGLRSREWDCAVFLHPWASAEAPRSLRRSARKPGSAHVQLRETWTEFRRCLSKSMRDNLAYYPRLLERSGFRVRVVQSDREIEFEEALQELVVLHKRRAWLTSDARRRDHIPAEPQKRFLTALHAADPFGFRVSVALLSANGIPVAAQLLLEDERTLVVGYSGYDPVFARFSPLLVLQAEVFRRALERGVERLNLLGGAAAWQERWRPRRDYPFIKETFVARRPAAMVRCAIYLSLRECRSLWEHSRVRRWIERSRVAAQSLSGFVEAACMHLSRHPHLATTARLIHHG